jgi:hypothetical protein
VTAEAAVVLPVMALFTLLMVWFVSWGLTAVRAQDAAREAARVIARGDDASAATALAHRVAPGDSAVDVRRGPESVEVVVSTTVRGPGGIFGFLPGVTVHGRAVAATEPDDEAQ